MLYPVREGWCRIIFLGIILALSKRTNGQSQNLTQNSEQAWRITLSSDDVTVTSRVHIVDDSIEDSRMSNGRNNGHCNEITVYGEQCIYELQLTYTGDPIGIKGKEERNEDGAREQCHLKSYQGQGH